MTQMMDLNKMGIAPLTEFEMQEIDGGGFWTWILGAAGAIVGFLLDGVYGAVEGLTLGFMAGAAIDYGNGDSHIVYNRG